MSKTQERAEVERQVRDLLGRSPGYRAMSTPEQREIFDNTVQVVHAMADLRAQQGGDPYAVAAGPGDPVTPGQSGGTNQSQTGYQYDTSKMTGGVGRKGAQEVKKGEFGAAIKTGVNQAGEMLRQINFPAFVTELIQGVFQSIVDASIKQMNAYAQLVQSVTMSLNQFRDANTTDNQARDHLVQKYPNLMQIQISSDGPRVIPRDTDGELPSFEDMGISEKVSSLDEDFIEQKLVPAARNELARSRQQLLATMVLMGISRIVVTDGKINAKLKFDFKARDSQQTHAQNWDYANMGNTTTWQAEYESDEQRGGRTYKSSADGSYEGSTGDSSRYAKGTWQYAQTPAVYVTSATDTTTNAELSASAQISSDVSINFKSEGVDLNKLVSESDIFRLEQVRSAGRGAPPPGGAAPPQSTPPAAGGNTQQQART